MVVLHCLLCLQHRQRQSDQIALWRSIVLSPRRPQVAVARPVNPSPEVPGVPLNSEFDKALATFANELELGRCYFPAEIAQASGCSSSTIRDTEQRALE